MPYCDPTSSQRSKHMPTNWTPLSYMRETSTSTCVFALGFASGSFSDHLVSYSLQTLHKTYLLRRAGAVIERPQFLYMRVAVALHGEDIRRVLQTYELLSSHAYTPATPTLYNAGTVSQYLASCFLYQPSPDGPVAVMGRSVVDVSAMWGVDGGVGMSLGVVPAQECVS